MRNLILMQKKSKTSHTLCTHKLKRFYENVEKTLVFLLNERIGQD
jgi:hypothetical protein